MESISLKRTRRTHPPSPSPSGNAPPVKPVKANIRARRGGAGVVEIVHDAVRAKRWDMAGRVGSEKSYGQLVSSV